MFVAVSSVLAGCGGGGGGNGGFIGSGDVSGVIFDQNGNPVRNAQVFYGGHPGNTAQTVSNSNGAYILKRIPALYDVIQCQLTSGGVSYFGQNLANLQDGQRTMTLNIALYPISQQASIHGTVADNHGNLLVGAKIYAIPANGKLMTSAYGVTDDTGHYFISGLLAGAAYNIQVNGLGYNSATDTETLSTGEDRFLSYTIAPASTTTLQPPTNVSAVAYTSPGEPTTPKLRGAMEAVKNIMNPGRRHFSLAKTRKAKATPGISNGSSPVEIDVFWTPISNASLLGYGVYSSIGGQPLTNIDFLSDPQGSVYEDMFAGLSTGVTYNYAVTTISTGFTGSTGESALSSTVAVTPTGPLALGTVTPLTNPTFTWSAASGASKYAILLFNQYPDIGVTDIFDNVANPVSGTSFTYSGAPLTSGQTYYFIVVGYGNLGGQSISPVGQFTVQ